MKPRGSLSPTILQPITSALYAGFTDSQAKIGGASENSILSDANLRRPVNPNVREANNQAVNAAMQPEPLGRLRRCVLLGRRREL